MSEISDALYADDYDCLYSLVVRRLSGDHLDMPIAAARGEAPRQVLVGAFHDSRNKEMFRQVLVSILEKEALKKAGTITSLAHRVSDIDSGEVYWLIEFLHLLIELEFKCAPESQLQLFRTIGNVNCEDPLCCELAVTSFSAYITTNLDRGRSAKRLFAPALDSLTVARDFCIGASKVAPKQFLSTFAPLVFENLSNEPVNGEDLGFLASAVRNCLTSLYHDDHKLGRPSSAFVASAAKHATSRSGPNLRRAAVQGLSQSIVPSKVLTKLEEKYWGAHPTLNVISASGNGVDRSRRHIAEWIRENSGGDEIVSPSNLVTNSIPYAEAALMRLHKTVLKLGYDVTVTRKSLNYAKVRSALLSKTIDFAVHNPTLRDQRVSGKQHEKLLASNFDLSNFSGYELLANRARLLGFAQRDDLTTPAQDLVSRLLEGEQFRLSDGMAPPPGFGELFSLGEIGCLEGTDTEHAARLFVGSSSSDQEQFSASISSGDPDRGMERLLDGEIAFYVGGALHASYALRFCPSRVVKIADIEKRVALRFYTTQALQEKKPQELLAVLESWRTVRRLWEMLGKPDRGGKEFKPFLELLSQDLVLSLNRDQTTWTAFVEDFDHLNEIIASRNELPFLTAAQFDAISFVSAGQSASEQVASGEGQMRVV